MKSKKILVWAFVGILGLAPIAGAVNQIIYGNQVEQARQQHVRSSVETAFQRDSAILKRMEINSNDIPETLNPDEIIVVYEIQKINNPELLVEPGQYVGIAPESHIRAADANAIKIGWVTKKDFRKASHL